MGNKNVESVPPASCATGPNILVVFGLVFAAADIRVCVVYALQKIVRCTHKKKTNEELSKNHGYEHNHNKKHKKTILNKRLCFKNCLRERDINFKKLNLQNIL